MEIIQLKKFGQVLVSRPAGLEAFNAIRPQLDSGEEYEIDFSDVLTVTPSWLDEFLTRLTDLNDGKVELLPTKNASVLVALPDLARARKDHVSAVVKRLMAKVGMKEDE